MNIYVGNLNYRLQEEDLKEVFGEYGEVVSVKIIADKYTGQSKGFGFVEMTNEEDGLRAIEELNGTDIKGRNVVVNKARPPQRRD